MSVGIWTFSFDGKKIGEVRDAASEVEELGFDTLWFGEYLGREAFTQAGLLLAATARLNIATGIARFSHREPIAAAAAERTLGEAYPGRFTLGLGGHLPGAKPLEAMRGYLDGMDEAALSTSDSPRRRLLAALGPKMLALAAERADGAHPYFVPVEHTAHARRIMGPSAYLAVEQAVVLGSDREPARRHVSTYLEPAAHHRANLRRFGFTEKDYGSDRLVDALVAVGEDAIHDRVRAHLDAGADHVCLQVLTEDDRIPLAEWRRLSVVAGSVRNRDVTG
ncbi:TIGR03620 family F420-dependent LLM class oxidoreductase [Amycolatopsis regifaucium]|uniref:LLM class F420-dependent oxidoreductase n=1 Tax=Amycolatopsis regifaucium TaxID=546365 RepID=A0A154MA73_9PSEU|nr:TIGR03620 family F420-dependent LLM class oxidoreductase [Amycolatopsis regifaucium]KZB81511.1 LLM class F420-dependent oxidoreductase [Amycolatopsis regifaucium]OKA06920.1 LLM class F420-dependent oxidoreductase [Amycolatopsis regifaucium]SFH29664.1 probable F420-dependent oxidoreductase, MSMEG_4141 family [Amycolatopsis regifaucium]